MKLLNLCFLYTPGTYMYHQQIKGKDNYDHRYGKKSFNGYGGCHEYGGSELLLAGENEDGRSFKLDVKEQVLELSGRKKLGEAFVKRLNASLPVSMEVEVDAETGKADIEKILKIATK